MHFVLSLSLLAGCVLALPARCQRVTFSPAPTPETLVQAHFDALNRHDLAALAAHYAAAATVRSPSWEGNHVGGAAVHAAYARYFASSPDLHYVVTRVVVAPTATTVEYTSTGTMAKPETGEPSYLTGQAYTLRNCTIFSFANGQITDESTYFDQVAFLRQVRFFDQPAAKK